MTRPVWSDPNGVNLVGVRLAPVYVGGYYLFDSPQGEGRHVGVVLANRERLLMEYRASHPLPWRKALSSVLTDAGMGVQR